MSMCNMTFFERKKELSLLSNRITYLLDMNGGVTNESIKVLMDTYRVTNILHNMYTDLEKSRKKVKEIVDR